MQIGRPPNGLRVLSNTIAHFVAHQQGPHSQGKRVRKESARGQRLLLSMKRSFIVGSIGFTRLCRGTTAGLVAVFFLGGVALAEDTSLAEMKARLDALEKSNQELKKALQETKQGFATAQGSVPLDSGSVEKIVTDMLKKKEEEKKAQDELRLATEAATAAATGDPDGGYRVGSDLKASVRWSDLGYLWLETPNKDFTMHIGGWFQLDNVFYGQNPALLTAPTTRTAATNKSAGIASGVATGGIGDLEDGEDFRRIRPFVEGTIWQTGEYRLILALENNQYSTVGLDEFWVGVNDIPILGTVRIGHVKDCVGLEGDMTSSSRCMTFLERSSYSEAIELNENFVTGVWVGNNYLDQHVTATGTVFRQDLGSTSGVYYGDGQWGAQGRLTALPLYMDDGRYLLHLGLSGGWRNGTSNDSTSSYRTFELRARDELRDDDPASGPSGAQLVPNANDNRMVDTGVIAAKNDFLVGTELLFIAGPLYFQAEYGWNRLQDAFGVAPSVIPAAGKVPATIAFNPLISPATSYTFQGGYVQLAYTLTGENRAYDRKIGTLAREYFATGPYENAFLVRNDNGGWNGGLGAWEIAARFSHVNLNDGVLQPPVNNGSQLNRIQGGIMDGVTLGVNWYLNNNVKFNFDWVHDYRYDMPIGSFAGAVNGFGARCQLSF
jgi:phosphate-selective porin OprO and OprP